MLTKQQIWDSIATPDNWDPQEGDRDLFFSDRLSIDVDSLDELNGVDIPLILEEMHQRGALQVELVRWGATFSSPDPDDTNDQDHHPTWGQAATEQCDRHYDKKAKEHSVSWCFG